MWQMRLWVCSSTIYHDLKVQCKKDKFHVFVGDLKVTCNETGQLVSIGLVPNAHCCVLVHFFLRFQ